MKFGQLTIGRRFGFRGETFVKESPLQATRESDGSKKLIPRSAVVVLLDDQGEPIKLELPAQVSRSSVQTALDQLGTELNNAIGRVDPALNPEQQRQLSIAISIANDKFIDSLALGGSINQNA